MYILYSVRVIHRLGSRFIIVHGVCFFIGLVPDTYSTVYMLCDKSGFWYILYMVHVIRISGSWNTVHTVCILLYRSYSWYIVYMLVVDGVACTYTVNGMMLHVIL